MDFKSDNIVGVHPTIIEAIINANTGVEASYGNDSYTALLKEKLSEIFETEVSIYLTSTGTAANGLALSTITPVHGMIYSHANAHVNTDECGAPELFTSGAKIVPLSGDNYKIDCNHLKQHIESSLSMRPHASKPGCITLSQATECGTIYSLEELRAIADIAKYYDLPIHMDGARFANSLITLKCTPAEATWKSGVDVLSFGATKNGALAAEVVIFFNQKYNQDADYKQKRAGQLISKMRFFSCQFLAYFENDLWLKNATHANSMAINLANIFIKYGLELEYKVEANELFVRMPAKLALYLQQNSGSFYEWEKPNDQGNGLYRFVTSCFTSGENLSKLEEYLKLYQA
ncbi:MAG: low specificity L-threonine aldolase [Rickettsiales bacterium]